MTSYARAAAAAERDERDAAAWLDAFGAEVTTDPLPDEFDERVTQALAPMLGRQLADPNAPDVDYVYVRDVYLTHLMGEPVDDRSEHASRGDTVERRRIAYGERVTSTTSVGIGPVGTFGSFLGVVSVTSADGDRTDLAVSPDTGRLAGTRQHTSRANGRKRVATCTCGTCTKCKTRARVQKHRARITEEQRRAERELALKH
jgi:hypothetical protein